MAKEAKKEGIEIGKRIQEVADTKFKSLAALARAMGLPNTQSLWGYLKGYTIPGREMQKRFIDAGVDVEYIMTGKRSIVSSLEQNFTINRMNFYKVIKSVNAGDPVFIYSEENDTGEVAGFEYEKTERCFSLRVQGDSMLSPNSGGKNLKEGDKVLVDMDAQILPGDVVVVSLVNGREIIKQYQLADDEDFIKLHSFNPQYPDIIVRTTDINIMYRVVAKSSLENW